MKKSEILEYGNYDKVLVRWHKSNNTIEYSVHTLGLYHTEEEHDLISGHYFGEDYATCNEYFSQYRYLYKKYI